MEERLPGSVARRSARATHQREQAVLENFEVLRDVQLAILGRPDLDTYVVAAEEMGYRTAMLNKSTVGVYRDEKLAFIATQADDDVVLAVAE
jgi:hypothetical protein